MSALSGYMCFQRCHIFRMSRTLLQAYVNKYSHRESYKKTRFPTYSSCLLLYSTQQSGTLKGLTDEILKAKTAAEKESDKSSKKDDSKGSKESKWTGKNAWRLGLVLMSGWSIISGGMMLYIWGSPPQDPDGIFLEDEYSHLPTYKAYLKRAMNEFSIFREKIQEPSRQKLLPDPLEYPYVQPRYTLVLEMTGVLVHPDWTYGTGWRFKKRPGIDHFLQSVAPPLFEIVIYTSEHGYMADALINSLDPNGFIMYRLYRDTTRYMDGHHVKDLSCLNRDLSKVIFLDWNPQSFKLQPKNTFRLKKWSGEDGDTTLYDLGNFLKTVGTSGVEDVRDVMEYYSQFDDPIAAFKENQRKLQEQEQALAQQQKQEVKKPAPSWAGLNIFKR
ncbi:mitochondrial import inner membrane translocase subunit TIM50-C-like [Gigantopelta aegis]|uniref:mitochondrial import inner membrane translocase subunit TIM50-C-like n=1 Tax=Gigantopelta aegis TaxID=1735272 RepID=UPI001B889004|nr:mitochondrial import inner membrane translocase subunit TIM50-C-like [Gigantopelta aegis]